MDTDPQAHPAHVDRATQDHGLARDVLAGMRDIPDFPINGVVFKDFTPLLLDPSLRDRIVADTVHRRQGRVDVVAGIEARGFILGAMIAHALGVGFVPVRKEGKLPSAVHSRSYALEYGTATLEIHQDAVSNGERVLIVDDVLATGGTLAATCELIERCGASVAAIELVLEIGSLQGRDRLERYDVSSILTV
ncbi:adenine phosphoribosyltransferase [Ornithinimicrobium pekingense]|uniref:Adenine phosphoribosyltransferase n=1 Tax=Ornithinimicrobium pekingense TaxID=384677 RepID=A0ABQ2FA12_9MICO|nr:adenine phosphoribosyltransferase [Ornithinimicrobium pekingense]GGK76329.1 adenine phosphoribosyltransferase [Ornithinimicrobium pekingense]